MSDRWPKVIRDPVHNIIPFEDRPSDRLLLALINTREFQRLRRIKQLGVSHFVFPGADHTRFAHSIGVMSMAKQFLARLETVRGKAVSEDERTAVLAAALLHDVGHGPFSHTFEKITGENHERRTRQIITDSSTEVNRTLGSLAEVLDDFFSEDIDDSVAAAGKIPRYLTQIVSSQFDADRFDYLLRDSYATGTDYGRFDFRWLLQNLFLDENKGRLYLGYKASLTVEAYIYARYHMYRSVYFHKTTRAAEVMLRLLFKRLKELLDAESGTAARRRVLPGVPEAVLQVFTASIPLDDYLMLDDCTIVELWKRCTAAPDSLLRELGRGLLDRRLYKAIDLTGAPPEQSVGFGGKARDLLQSLGLASEYNLVCDAPADTPYKPYDPDAETPANQTYLERPNGNIEPISTDSAIVQTLAKRYILTRYYCPVSLHDRLKGLLS